MGTESLQNLDKWQSRSMSGHHRYEMSHKICVTIIASLVSTVSWSQVLGDTQRVEPTFLRLLDRAPSVEALQRDFAREQSTTPLDPISWNALIDSMKDAGILSTEPPANTRSIEEIAKLFRQGMGSATDEGDALLNAAKEMAARGFTLSDSETQVSATREPFQLPVSSAENILGANRDAIADVSYQAGLGHGSDSISFPYYQTGSVTPIANWPTALVASYNGNISGALNTGASVTGTISMTVDFAKINSRSPEIPGSIVFAGGKGGTTFTLAQIGGYVGNSMSGTYDSQAVTGFIMNGQFYGPQANEVGGLWSMQNTNATLTGNGNFAGKR